MDSTASNHISSGTDHTGASFSSERPSPFPDTLPPSTTTHSLVSESTSALSSTRASPGNSDGHISELREAPRADFSITCRSESTTSLNATFQRLMDTIHTMPKLSIRGPMRLPKEDNIHSRRLDIRSIQESQFQTIAARSGICLSEYPGEERAQGDGVSVSFDIE